jgi:hypothetical protein
VTGLDTEALREALRAGTDPGAAPPDLTLIMDRGGRLRRRRRVAAVTGTLCALALLAGAGTGIADLASSSPASVQPVSPARSATHGARHPAPAIATTGPATPVPVPTATPPAPLPKKSAPAASPAAATVGVSGQPVSPAVTGQATTAAAMAQATTAAATGQPAATRQPPTAQPSSSR